MFELSILYLWAALSGAIAVAAAAPGRHPALWLFVAFIFSPLVAWA